MNHLAIHLQCIYDPIQNLKSYLSVLAVVTENMADCASDEAGGDAINELFKHDHGITHARRQARKAEAKCRLMLKRALKQGDIRFCNSCISSFANDGMLGLALVIVREVFEKAKFKPTE